MDFGTSPSVLANAVEDKKFVIIIYIGHLPTVNWDYCKILNPKLINVSELNIGLQNVNEETFQPTPFQNCKAPIRFVYGSDDQLISGPKTVS